jgi:D-alanine-D-alanine ligase
LKIVVIYNRVSKKVINLFGVPNRERYGQAAIQRIVNGLKKGGHQVKALEGDKDLVDNIEKFMPRVLKGERPGMAFNLSYGIQGQARYTHVPGMLEMVGIPYVGSGPLAHSLSLDKVVAKMLFIHNGLPTPEFAVLTDASFEAPELNYPLIVKPRNEAVSFGIKIANNYKELREAADIIFEQFHQGVLVEEYIEGREINVGIIGNQSAQAFPPAEIIFGKGGPNIYTYEDKTRQSGREIEVICPAVIEKKIADEARRIALQAFSVLGCYDCARIDMRMNKKGKLYILEVNSLPSLGERGSYAKAAEVVGLDFPALVNRLVEEASTRYFGTPTPPEVTTTSSSPSETVFLHLTQYRDRIENKLEDWVAISSRSDDFIGIQLALKEAEDIMKSQGLTVVPEYSDTPHAITWETKAGLKNGTLIIAHLDTPINIASSAEPFRRDPEWLYGEGAGSSRGAMTSLEFSLKALKRAGQLQKIPLGVLLHTDEGRDAKDSAEFIEKAATLANRVLILRSGNLNNRIVTRRRGQRKYRLVVESKPLRPGHASTRNIDALSWLYPKLDAITKLTSRAERTAVAAVDVKPEAYPLLLPHRVVVALLVSFPANAQADRIEEEIRNILGKYGPRWSLVQLSDRPPMRDRKINKPLINQLKSVAKTWEIPIKTESSLWPSVAGLVPQDVPVLCGLGPVVTGLYTSQEAVSRISLVQRTLLLTEMLLGTISNK